MVDRQVHPGKEGELEGGQPLTTGAPPGEGTSESEGKLVVRSLSKRYHDTLAVDDVSFSVRAGELLCLLGPSGCGKSTLLRMIAGLEEPTEGQIIFDGKEVTDHPPYRRDFSMVFQDWALFPTRTVLGNVEFGLKMRGERKADRRDRALACLDLVDMADFGDKPVTELSGGQKQRVALARSLAIDPDVLLLDEPLSNLDKRLREQLQMEIKAIHDELKTTMVYVTHDQKEAFTLADRIGILKEGTLVQLGTPREINTDPKSRFVEEFVGETNLIPGTIVNTENGKIELDTFLDEILTIPSQHRMEVGDEVTVALRPRSIALGTFDDSHTESDPPHLTSFTNPVCASGNLHDRTYRGKYVQYEIQTNDGLLTAHVQPHDDTHLREAERLEVHIDQDDLLIFDADGSRLG